MARSFNGTSDKIVTSGIASTLTNGTTVCGWFNANSTQNVASPIPFYNGIGSSSNGYGMRFFNFSGGTYNFGAVAAGVGQGSISISINCGAWNHFLFTVDTSLGWNGYVNGVLTGPGEGFISSLPNAPATSDNFGFAGGSDTSFYAGGMADVAIWNTRLTAGEALAIGAYGARPLQIRPSSLAGYWPLDGLASPEADYSGNKNNGTLTGTSLFASAPPMMQFTPRWPQQVISGAAASSIVFRRDLSGLGTRGGTRQVHGWSP